MIPNSGPSASFQPIATPSVAACAYALGMSVRPWEKFILFVIGDGHSDPVKIAAATGYSERTVNRVIRKFNRGGWPWERQE